MRIDHYLKDADQWQSHNLVWCWFVCTICVVEIDVDESIAVLTIVEHVVWCWFVCTICVVEIDVDESIAVLTIVEHVA